VHGVDHERELGIDLLAHALSLVLRDPRLRRDLEYHDGHGDFVIDLVAYSTTTSPLSCDP